MTVRRGVTLDFQPVAAMRQPSFRTSRMAQAGAIIELFGSAAGQSFTVIVDEAIRVTRQVQCAADASVRVRRPFVFLVDLHQRMGGCVSLLADARVRISAATRHDLDVRLRIGLRVTRLADLSQVIGVGAELSADAALTIYRVVLHEDHLILI